MISQLLVVLSVGIVGALIGSLVEQGLKEVAHTWPRRIAFALIGFAMASSIVNSITIELHLEEVKKRIEALDVVEKRMSTYHDVERQVLENSSRAVRAVVSRQLASVDDRVGRLSRSRAINVSSDEVIPVWMDLVGNAERCVCATNLVGVAKWAEVGNDNGLTTQLAAIGRGVSIIRVNLVDPLAPTQMAELRALRTAQSRAGISVFEMPLARVVDNPSYNRLRNELDAVDVVVVDDSIALLTRVKPNTYDVNGATITFDPEQVRAAKEFISRTLQAAGGQMPQKCK